MIQIRAANNARLQALFVLEHTIVFDANGLADGSALSTEELDRLRRFHFLIDEIPDAPAQTVPDAHAEPEGDEPIVLLATDEEEGEAPAPEKQVTRRTNRKVR